MPQIELEAMAAPERLEAPAQRSFQQLGALVEEVGVRMADADWLMSESGVLRASVASSAREVCPTLPLSPTAPAQHESTCPLYGCRRTHDRKGTRRYSSG